MEYPVLKQVSNDMGEYRIVLFTGKNDGIVLETNVPDTGVEVGYQGDFNEEVYAKFHGTVRINNDIFGDE